MPQTISPEPTTRPGLTLIELVLAMAISTIALLVIVLGYNVGVKTFTQETSRSDIFWEGNTGLETVTEELRESLALLSPEATSISFWWRDLNDDDIQQANEVVDYTVANQILVRTQGTETKPLVHNVVGFDLAYDLPADPELVTVTLTMKKEGQTATLESNAGLRNK